MALIARSGSYLHTHLTVESRGQPGWLAALRPLSVDGMILAASTTLLTDSLAGKPGGVLPWALLVVGSVASLAANVAVALPTAAGRVIAPGRRGVSVGRSHNGTHTAAIAAPGGIWLRCARCCSGRVTCQWLRRWAELRRGEFARRSPGQQAGCAQSARDLISRLATAAAAGPRRAGT
jgi:Protein of unknown function (DUF2637)